MAETRTYTVKSGERSATFRLHHDPAYIPDLAAEKFFDRQWEPELVHLMFRAIRPGQRVIDAGANIGIFTLLMSHLVGSTGFVHAFEPHPDTIRRLASNLSLNDVRTGITSFGNVLPHETALWNANRDLTIYTCAADPGLNALKWFEGCTGSRTVRADRLDHIFPTPPAFIKLDIEGAEEHAMRGAEKWLTQNPLVACEYAQAHLERFGTTRKKFADYMRGFGYSLWLLDPDDKPPQMVPPDRDVVGGSENMVVLFATRQQVSTLWPT